MRHTSALGTITKHAAHKVAAHRSSSSARILSSIAAFFLIGGLLASALWTTAMILNVFLGVVLEKPVPAWWHWWQLAVVRAAIDCVVHLLNVLLSALVSLCSTAS